MVPGWLFFLLVELFIIFFFVFSYVVLAVWGWRDWLVRSLRFVIVWVVVVFLLYFVLALILSRSMWLF